MERMENRGCHCGCGNNSTVFSDNTMNNNWITGQCSNNESNMSMTAYNVTNVGSTGTNEDCCPIDRDPKREEMMSKIRELDFAIVELGLYLDTHPDDQKALCLHREYSKQIKDLKDKYQKVYGPLTILYPCNKWRWLEEPWPWERGNY